MRMNGRRRGDPDGGSGKMTSDRGSCTGPVPDIFVRPGAVHPRVHPPEPNTNHFGGEAFMLHRPMLLLGAGILVACARPEGNVGDAADSPAAASAPNVVTFTASDFVFEAPDTIPAGLTTIRLVNQGAQWHHAQLLRFDEGRTYADFEAALRTGGPPPAWVHEVGGPNPPPFNGASNTTQMLEPGNYAVVCLVDTPDRVPHVMKGMAKAFTVVPSSTTSASAPAADVTMQLSDYAFTLSAPLTPGTHTVRVENTATQPHEVVVLKLEEGKTVDDLTKWAQNYEGTPPAATVGGVAAMDPGQPVFFTIDMTPGNYVFICFVPDAKDGKPHVAHGMIQTLSIQ